MVTTLSAKERLAGLSALLGLTLISTAPVFGQDQSVIIGITPEPANTPSPSDAPPAPLTPTPEVIESPVPALAPPAPSPVPEAINSIQPESIPSLLDQSQAGSAGDSHHSSRVITEDQINSFLGESSSSSIGSSVQPKENEEIGYSVLPPAPSATASPHYSASDYCPDVMCPNPHRCWARADVLGLWIDNFRIPTLLTTAPNGTLIGVAGQLDQANTTSLLGSTLDNDVELAGRLSFGHWLEQADTVAIEAEVMAMTQGSQTQTFASVGNPILARPIFNTNPAVNAADADVVAFAGTVSGEFAITNKVELYSGSFGMRLQNLAMTDPCRGRQASLIAGFRYLRLEEMLRIDDRRTALAAFNSLHGVLAAGTTFDSFDQFRTTNDFYGFDFGSTCTVTHGPLSVSLLSKVGVGVAHQLVEIDGQRVITPGGGAATTLAGGLLTGEGNLGQHARRRFAVVPEVRLDMGYQVSRNLKTSLGYQYMMFSNVLRPGDHIDTVVNGTLLDPAVADAGAVRPTFDFRSDIVHMHGLTASLEFTY